jgi:hypothetical protein
MAQGVEFLFASVKVRSSEFKSHPTKKKEKANLSFVFHLETESPYKVSK